MKTILDACCGPKFMWNNKNHPNVIYIDIRKEEKGYVGSRENCFINPDFIMDFRKLPLEWDKKFKLIVWDPPHLLGKNYDSGIMIKKYGCLIADKWRDDFKKGFNELWRCLDDNGVLIFKFNDYHIKHDEVLKCFHTGPLFSNVTNTHKGKTTRWFCFMKL
jgi:SAM-dependent methyltransferase